MSVEAIALNFFSKIWLKLRWIGPKGSRITLLVLGVLWIFGGARQIFHPDYVPPEPTRLKHYKPGPRAPEEHVAIRGAAVLVNGVVISFFALRRGNSLAALAARVSLICSFLVSLALGLLLVDPNQSAAVAVLMDIGTVAFMGAFLLVLLRMVSFHEQAGMEQAAALRHG